MTLLRRFLASAILGLLLVPAVSAANEPPKSPVFPAWDMKNPLAEEKLTAEQLKELEEGEIITFARPKPKGWDGAHVVAVGLVKAPVEKIYEVVMDCTGQPRYTPHLEECKNTYSPGTDPATATTYKQYQKLKFGFGFISKEVTYTNSMFAIRPWVSGWVLDKGDIAQSIGYWRVIPYKDGANLLLYDVYSDPGMAVPDFIQEALTKSDLPNTVAAFREEILRRQENGK